MTRIRWPTHGWLLDKLWPHHPELYAIELFRRRGKWSSRIRHANGEILWSTTSQLYSRKTDALRTAARFSKATGIPIKEPPAKPARALARKKAR